MPRIKKDQTEVVEFMGFVSSAAPRWELAAENIAVKIRWVGVIVGYLAVNFAHLDGQTSTLNAILALGAIYTLIDTYFSTRGRVFLGEYPLLISAMEALFIGLLCHFHIGPDSPFRIYYVLSLIICAFRHSPRITLLTCIFHGLSISGLYLSLPTDQRDVFSLILTWVVLGWVTWAASALALLLKRFSDHLSRLNDHLREQQAFLEARIEERTKDLQEAQAKVLHQEKMAAFGLLAAGIAHEVGNPLTSISSIVQMLERRHLDVYTRERLELVSGQLQRIRGTLRELIEFSRPAGSEKVRCTVREVIEEALNIAKYYKGTKSRKITVHFDSPPPMLFAYRDQMVQIFLNLILNAVDASSRNGRIEITVTSDAAGVTIDVADDGPGVPPEQQPRLFQPYFTTKKHGTGLGLFVTRKLVEEHGGWVRYVASEQPGARFRIWLPGARSPWPSDSKDINGESQRHADELHFSATDSQT
jgi:signal transduction histidine kinase